MAVRRPRIKPTANLSVKRAKLSENNAGEEKKAEVPAIVPKPEPEPVAVVKKEKEEAPKPVPLFPFSPKPIFGSPIHVPSPSQSPGLFKQPERNAHTPEIDDSIFKSPLSSPSYPAFRNTNLTIKMTPQDLSFSDEYSKGPSSPVKARPKFKPTPVFAQRRNSLQSSDVEEEPKRQRNLSFSSSQPYPPSPTVSGGRVRTESVSSSFSDRSVFKPRRLVRSEDHQRLTDAKRELFLKFNGNPDKNKLRIYDMIYYNPTTNPMKNPASKESLNEARERRLSMCSNPSLKSEPKSDKSNADEEKNDAMPVPQLKLGPNGEMILDEKSLYIEKTGEKEAKALAKANIIYDDEFNSNCGFYKRQKRSKDWPPDETIKFYRCLRAIGTDFSLMLQLFPNRTRRDLKVKFKKEEKINGSLITKALVYHNSSFDIEELKAQLDQEEKQKKENLERSQRLKNEQKISRSEVIQKIRQTRTLSRASGAMTDGDFICDNYEIGDFRKIKPKKINRENEISSPEKRIQSPSLSHCELSQESLSVPPSPIYSAPTPIPDQINTVYTESEVLQMETVLDTNSNVSVPEIGNEENIFIITIPEANSDCQIKQEKPFTQYRIAIKEEKGRDEEKEKEKEKAIEVEEDQVGEEEEEEGESDDEDFEDDEDDDPSKWLHDVDISSLVVIETKDPNDENVIRHKIHTMNKKNQTISDACLDLPEHIVECIVHALRN